jgi:hypothetical protein
MGTHFRARRGLRALVVSTVMSLALVGASTNVAGAATPTNRLRAQRGAQWLANQIKHNGGFLINLGEPDPVDTAYAVIGMRSVGVDKGASNVAIAYLKTKIGTKLRSGGVDAPGAIAEYILASVANGGDPHQFGGTGAINNLVNRLLATVRTSGPDKGLFGAQDPTYDGAFRQGLSLAALAAARVAPSDARVASAITWLTTQQCANGLWQAYRASTATPCAASDPNTFSGPDTNSTAQAVQGLAAWNKHPGKTSVLHSLQQVQSSDAGFPYIAATNQSSDPDSTALVIQAILAEGGSPVATTWTVGAKNPYTALAHDQVGCHTKGFGGFAFPPSAGANVFATVQAVPAMGGKVLPVASSSASTVVSIKNC